MAVSDRSRKVSECTGAAIMNQYAIYCRKSSESEDRQILSIPAQIDELKKLAKHRSLRVSRVLTESKSAKAPGRPVFNEMMASIQNGEIQGIICWKLDRLARNPVDGGSIIWAIKEKNIEIVTPPQNYNQSSENSFMMYVEFGMAQKFVDDLSKNVKRGLKQKAEKGWLPSGAKPGYMNDKYAEKGNKTVLKDPIRFPLIRKCWDYMLTGAYTPAKILRLLNEEWGYTTPTRKSIGGNPMTRSQIYRLFSDPFYYGYFEYPVGSNTWHKGAHEPMITKAEFDKVQILAHRPGSPRPKKMEFAHTGLIRCGECGAFITAEEKWHVVCKFCKYKFTANNQTECPKCKKTIEEMDKPVTRHYIYYHCTKRKDPNCTQGSIQEKQLEEQIDAYLARIGITEEFKNWAIKYLNELNDRETETNSASLRLLQESYNRTQSELDNLLKLKISSSNIDGSLLSDEEFRIQKEKLVAEKTRVKELLDDAGHRSDKWMETAEKAFNFAIHARYWFAHGTAQEKREIMTAIGSNLIFQDKLLRMDLQKPYFFIEEAVKAEPTISQMFEPKEKSVTTSKLEELWAQNLLMLPR